MNAPQFNGPDDRDLDPACRDCGAGPDEPCDVVCGCADCRKREFEALDAHEQYMAEIAAQEREWMTFAHMCRDGHVIIGHNNSEHEMCPLCSVLSILRSLVDVIDVHYQRDFFTALEHARTMIAQERAK